MGSCRLRDPRCFRPTSGICTLSAVGVTLGPGQTEGDEVGVNEQT